MPLLSLMARDGAGDPLESFFGPLEFRILEALWRRDSALPASAISRPRSLPAAYTTILTTLERLRRKGFLTRDSAGARLRRTRRCWGRAELTERLASRALGAWLRRSGGGRPDPVLLHRRRQQPRRSSARRARSTDSPEAAGAHAMTAAPLGVVVWLATFALAVILARLCCRPLQRAALALAREGRCHADDLLFLRLRAGARRRSCRRRRSGWTGVPVCSSRAVAPKRSARRCSSSRQLGAALVGVSVWRAARALSGRRARSRANGSPRLRRSSIPASGCPAFVVKTSPSRSSP